MKMTRYLKSAYVALTIFLVLCAPSCNENQDRYGTLLEVVSESNRKLVVSVRWTNTDYHNDPTFIKYCEVKKEEFDKRWVGQSVDTNGWHCAATINNVVK